MLAGRLHGVEKLFAADLESVACVDAPMGSQWSRGPGAPRISFLIWSSAHEQRYILEDNFEVFVGKPSKSKRFTIHTNVFASCSGILAVVQESEPGTEKKPAELGSEEPELFQSYLNCMYFGSETLEQWADAAEVEAHSEGRTQQSKSRQSRTHCF
jgi:hypothetical protein